MTVSTAVNKVQAIGDGSTLAFSFPHIFFANADLEVLLTVILTEVTTVQVLTTDYTVTGAGDQNGGTVTFVVAPPSTDRVTIKRVVTQDHQTDYQNASSFDQEVLEKDQDLAIMNIQQMQEEIDRAPKLDPGTASIVVFPAPDVGKVLGWDSGKNLANLSQLPAAVFSASSGDEFKPVRVNSAFNGLEGHVGLSRPSKAISVTTVLTDGDEHAIIVSGLAGNINLDLPGTSNVKRVDERIVINLDATFSVVIRSTDAATILTLPPSRNVTLIATQDAPTTPAHWAVPSSYIKGGTLEIDTISEETAAAGVTVDGLVIKDSGFQTGGTHIAKVVGLINSQFTQISTSIAANLMQFTLSADTLDVDGKAIRIIGWGTKSGANSVGGMQINFGGSSISVNNIAQNGVSWRVILIIMRSAVGQQRCMIEWQSGLLAGWSGASGLVSGNIDVDSVTSTGDETTNLLVDVEVFSMNAGDTITMDGMLTEILN